MPARGTVGAGDFDELVPECAIAVADGRVVVASLTRGDHDRLRLRKELQREVGRGRRPRRPYLAPTLLDKCYRTLGDPARPSIEQDVAGALGREEYLSLIVDELGQRLLRRAGAGEAAVE